MLENILAMGETCVRFENSPPPSDFQYDDVEEIPISFIYPRPQHVFVPRFISVDYSLIHPFLLLPEKNSAEIDENEINETSQEGKNNKMNENSNENLKGEEKELISRTECEKICEPEQINLTDEKNLNAASDENTIDHKKQKRKYKHYKKSEYYGKGKDTSTYTCYKEDNMCAVQEKKTSKRKQCKKNHSQKDLCYMDADDENCNDNDISVSISKIERNSISHSKESETNENDPNLRKPMTHKSLKAKKSKRILVSDGELSSSSDRSKAPDYSPRKSRQCKSVSSDTEDSLSHRSEAFSRLSHCKQRARSLKRKIKHEVFSDEEESSYLKKTESIAREMYSASDASSKKTIYKGHRNKHFDRNRSESYSPKKEVKKEIKHEYKSERYSPKREVKREIKHESMDASNAKECYGPDDFYCTYCKLTLNSELTWKSHLNGKKHAKARRAQSVTKIAKTSLISAGYVPISEDTNRHNKPPSGMERKELIHAVSSIQEVCDDLKDRQVVGLKHVWEIRGEAETTYYCNLCDAPCGPSSVMPHLIGYKHRLSCLKEYFPKYYDKYKDAQKRTIDRVIDDKFHDYESRFRKEKVRVFKEIPIHNKFDEKPGSYLFNQPGPSWQRDSEVKLEALTIKDENGKTVVPSNQECLDTKFADFYCTVCDSHMNNIQMWEAHIRGKRHLKNLSKAPQELDSTNKYIKAPATTVSDLERKIEKECGPNDIIFGLNYIRENQGKHGNQYNCFPCGGCCSDIDIIDHLLAMKHKIKILEKMDSDDMKNAITELNLFDVPNYYREGLINEQCLKMVNMYGIGKPQVYYIKRDLRDCGSF